jgi:holo-[acyl-carrier protein] synthase
MRRVDASLRHKPPLLGFDLESPTRLARRLAARPGFEEWLFTPGERAYCRGRARAELHLAARYCAKEATVKALALDVFKPQQIEVLGGGQQCRLVLHGDAAARAHDLGVVLSVSLTHTPDIAGAVVLARHAA